MEESEKLNLNFSSNLNYALLNLEKAINEAINLEDKIYLELSKNQIIEYFTIGNKEKLLEAFDLSKTDLNKYTLNDRYKYGFPISNIEYGTAMKKLVLSLQKKIKNRINIK